MASSAEEKRIDAQFDKTEETIRTPREVDSTQPKFSIRTSQQLKLYGLYKQATKGNINVTKPWLDPIGRAKWDAWNNISEEGLSKTEAKKHYVDTFLELLRNDQPAEFAPIIDSVIETIVSAGAPSKPTEDNLTSKKRNAATTATTTTSSASTPNTNNGTVSNTPTVRTSNATDTKLIQEPQTPPPRPKSPAAFQSKPPNGNGQQHQQHHLQPQHQQQHHHQQQPQQQQQQPQHRKQGLTLTASEVGKDGAETLETLSRVDINSPLRRTPLKDTYDNNNIHADVRPNTLSAPLYASTPLKPLGSVKIPLRDQMMDDGVEAVNRWEVISEHSDAFHDSLDIITNTNEPPTDNARATYSNNNEATQSSYQAAIENLTKELNSTTNRVRELEFKLRENPILTDRGSTSLKDVLDRKTVALIVWPIVVHVGMRYLFPSSAPPPASKRR